MKKNIFSDNQSGKSSKGFYVALGISAVMIGSACYFAYDEGKKLDKEKLAAENRISASEEAVDKKYTNIPRFTTALTSHTTTATTATTTAAPTTTTHTITLPAASITVADPPAEQAAADPSVDAAVPKPAKLENISAPLADISNVISPFSGTELVKNETTGSWQTHNGADIAAEVGSEVFAISPGEVTAINDDPLWGVTVTIDHHNGFISKYCGLASDLSVQTGDILASGDTIGVIGNTTDIESALAPHLHIEITHNGSYQNPMSLLTN